MRVIKIQQKGIVFIMLIILFLNFVMAEDFGVNMQQIQQCEPNSYACSLDDSGREVIKQCNSVGTKYEIIENCNSYEECKLTYEGAECISENKKEFSSNSFLLIIGGIILIVLVIILIRKKK